MNTYYLNLFENLNHKQRSRIILMAFNNSQQRDIYQAILFYSEL